MLDATIEVSLEAFHLDLRLRVDDGEVVALLGPNGAGKTTVLRTIAGLQPLDAGRITLDGAVLDDPATDTFVPTAQRPVGVVFQDYLLFPRMSALDNVAFGLRARGLGKAEARARAHGWLRRLDIDDHAGARPRTLSGGQAQRVALARALATDPRLLLLDEPLAALDASTRLQVRTELRRHLATFAGARLLITHDPVDALVLADRLVIVEAGRVTQSGTPAEVTARPRSRYVAELVGINLLLGTAVDTHTVRLPTGALLTLADPLPHPHPTPATPPTAHAPADTPTDPAASPRPTPATPPPAHPTTASTTAPDAGTRHPTDRTRHDPTPTTSDTDTEPVAHPTTGIDPGTGQGAGPNPTNTTPRHPTNRASDTAAGTHATADLAAAASADTGHPTDRAGDADRSTASSAAGHPTDRSTASPAATAGADTGHPTDRAGDADRSTASADTGHPTDRAGDAERSTASSAAGHPTDRAGEADRSTVGVGAGTGAGLEAGGTGSGWAGGGGLEIAVAIRPQAIALHRQRPDGSPRNMWSAIVTDLEADRDRVRVTLDGPVPVTAEITPAAVAELELAPGVPVWATVKATDLAAYRR